MLFSFWQKVWLKHFYHFPHDIDQVTFLEFRLGRFLSPHVAGCPDGGMLVQEGRGQVGFILMMISITMVMIIDNIITGASPWQWFWHWTSLWQQRLKNKVSTDCCFCWVLFMIFFCKLSNMFLLLWILIGSAATSGKFRTRPPSSLLTS